jgi:LacI family transcriptional regulator
LVPRLQDFVLATVYEAIDHAAASAGLMTMVTNSFDDQVLREDRIERLLERRVDGLVLCDAQLHDPVLARLSKRGVPFVLAVRRARAEYPHVVIDDVRGGELVADHLVKQGRRRLAVIAGHPQVSTTEDRLAGFVAGAARLGVEVTKKDVVYGGFDAAEGASGMRALLERGIPDAVFAMNDFAAIGALAPLRERGLSVPDDVALVGYNDTPLGASLTVPLTSVRIPLADMGSNALAMLTDARTGHEPTSQTLKPELVIRGSSM